MVSVLAFWVLLGGSIQMKDPWVMIWDKNGYILADNITQIPWKKMGYSKGTLHDLKKNATGKKPFRVK